MNLNKGKNAVALRLLFLFVIVAVGCIPIGITGSEETLDMNKSAARDDMQELNLLNSPTKTNEGIQSIDISESIQPSFDSEVEVKEVIVLTEESAALTPPSSVEQEWVNYALMDLADRLGIQTDEIIFTDYKRVIWPDAGLGCPHPDIFYTQVQQEGYLILLQVGNKIYSYHGGGLSNKKPFLCENESEGNLKLDTPGFGDE
jgi:hypothetical protein